MLRADGRLDVDPDHAALGRVLQQLVRCPAGGRRIGDVHDRDAGIAQIAANACGLLRRRIRAQLVHQFCLVLPELLLQLVG